ncbi:MAG TPA: hypothetical protein VKA70_07915 [Blastocatellia bacterium]|nr:hypothetical protein [Blastocatellia bacterium]
MKRLSTVLSLVILLAVSALAQTNQPPKVDAAALKELVGRYELDPTMVENFIVDVTLENGELWAKPSHQPKHRLIARPNGEYTDDQGIGVIFRFNRDKQGKVIGLSLTQEGNTVEARKLEVAAPSLKGNTTFKLKGHAGARVVAVAGSFNNWNQSQYFFAREGDEWVCRVDLAPGKHLYKFIIDGDWVTDPANPDTEEDERGNVNSVLVVKAK